MFKRKSLYCLNPIYLNDKNVLMSRWYTGNFKVIYFPYFCRCHCFVLTVFHIKITIRDFYFLQIFVQQKLRNNLPATNLGKSLNSYIRCRYTIFTKFIVVINHELKFFYGFCHLNYEHVTITAVGKSLINQNYIAIRVT